MTDNHDHDLQPDVGMDRLAEREELDSPARTALSAAAGGARNGMLALAGGGVLLLSAVKSLARGQLRAIPKGVAGAGLVGLGLRQRRSGDDSTIETGAIEDGLSEASDAARAAVERPEAETEEQPRKDPATDPETADTEDDGGEIEFTHDEPGDRDPTRSKPDLDADVEDPRRNDEDDSVEIDVSESALADEASEAAGPSPEQAQPAQTDATEPEETPTEDASDMKVEPDDDEDGAGTRMGGSGDDEDEGAESESADDETEDEE